jgi:hypothetical protein
MASVYLFPQSQPMETLAEVCTRLCYDAKSAAYQICQQIPPEQRDQRNSCFRAADQALSTCLGRCGGQSKASELIAIGVSVGLITYLLLA